ncbi:BQ5605_C007g04780 [Microbotryum silenes-dioicae]|uniref:BQ5605_C007g04780 protein n=1 Tax=Microbotryum silenes-dioicae TaxID=796604 RepID=A0A2X0M801_9BASI|nr:BQ5605_C007g04780 [Microbotryum silenes-dioicae]
MGSKWRLKPRIRALAAYEADFTDRLLNIKDAYEGPACFGPTHLNQPNQAPKLNHLITIDGNFQQWRNQVAKHDPQATLPDLFDAVGWLAGRAWPPCCVIAESSRQLLGAWLGWFKCVGPKQAGPS